ncbi:MAG: hypothetical protein DRJ29_17570 [Bacteroidetes bacterium]|nr:MAG: hypothetical protein DRJ29_17570 [Bacteroidota bacterium]
MPLELFIYDIEDLKVVNVSMNGKLIMDLFLLNFFYFMLLRGKTLKWPNNDYYIFVLLRISVPLCFKQ